MYIYVLCCNFICSRKANLYIIHRQNRFCISSWDSQFAMKGGKLSVIFRHLSKLDHVTLCAYKSISLSLSLFITASRSTQPRKHPSDQPLQLSAFSDIGINLPVSQRGGCFPIAQELQCPSVLLHIAPFRHVPHGCVQLSP